MTHFKGHNQLKNRYRFSGKLKMETPLRISSGRASDETDAPIMRTINNIPFIPGTSLRGAIRSELERVIAGAGAASGITGCILFEKNNCTEKYLKMIRNLEKTGINNEKKSEKIDEFIKNELCHICRLFGSTMYSSSLFIEDAMSVDNNGFKTRVRDGVAIHRDNGATVEGAKFDYEVIESGPDFEFKMTVENIDTDSNSEDKKLVNLILKLLKNGIYVGGKRTGGLGRIRLLDYQISGFESPESLWEALVNNSKIEKKIENWEEVI